MKKYFAVILTLVVMFSLASCSTPQSASQETSSTISETKDISEYLIEEDGEQYLILPITQSKILVLDEYKQHLNNIDVELLKTAEETICDKISVYTELPGFSLRFDDSGYLCLHIERIVDIEPPNVITDDNGEIINGGCNIDHKHIFFDERITKQTQTNSNVPEDFTFALTWNCYGISSYDSQTGKLVKTTDATNPDDYVTYYQLTDQDKEYIYNLIAPLDVGSYPEVYDPQNGMSAPSMTLILTVYCNGTQKTIKAENIALSFTSEDEKGQDFLSVCEAICNRLTATEEWKELPDYENLYD